MRSFSLVLMIMLGAAFVAPSAAQPNSAGSSEAALAKLDLEQKGMVAKVDLVRLSALAARQRGADQLTAVRF